MEKEKFYVAPDIEFIGVELEGSVFATSGNADTDDLWMEEW